MTCGRVENCVGRRQRRHLGLLSQYQCRRILVVFVAIIFTLVISISLHLHASGGKAFWQDAIMSPIASNATYDDDEEKLLLGGGAALEYHDEGCRLFRSYPSSRLYGLSSAASDQQQKHQPDFLLRATYIRGKWPTILNPIERDDEQWQSPPS